jgi:hypothetical protein
MSIEADLVTTLWSVFSGRLYLQRAPANVVPPYAVYQKISGVPEEVMDGATPNLNVARFQVSIFGREAVDVFALEASAKTAMTAATLFKSTCLNEMDEPDELGLYYGRLVDFSVWHN